MLIITFTECYFLASRQVFCPFSVTCFSLSRCTCSPSKPCCISQPVVSTQREVARPGVVYLIKQNKWACCSSVLCVAERLERSVLTEPRGISSRLVNKHRIAAGLWDGAVRGLREWYGAALHISVFSFKQSISNSVTSLFILCMLTSLRWI